MIAGRRVYPDETGHLRLKPGDYGKDKEGVWVARTPKGITGVLLDHKVIEHEDGMITISPSIVIEGDHFIIEKGIWLEV